MPHDQFSQLLERFDTLDARLRSVENAIAKMSGRDDERDTRRAQSVLDARAAKAALVTIGIWAVGGLVWLLQSVGVVAK